MVGKYSSLIFYYEKNIKYGENKLTRTRSNVFMHTQMLSVTIQGNITVVRYRDDVIRLVLLLHIRASLGILAGDYTSCYAARTTLVMFVANNVHKPRWPANSLDLNPNYHLLDILKRKVHAQPPQLKHRELTRVLFIIFLRPFHKSMFIDTYYQ